MDEPQTEKKKNGRWLIPFMVIVLLVVVGAIAGSLLVDRRPAPEPTVAASGTDEARDIPSPTAEEQDRPASPAPSPDAPAATPTGTDDLSAEEQNRPTSTNPSAGAPVAVPTGIHAGEAAPGFTLKDFNGKSVSLSDYRGKVVIIDFWASWCAPCRSSMPGLKGLQKAYQDQGVVMIGVSLDRTEAAAANYLKDNGYDDVIGLWESASASQNVARLYGVSGIPHTLVLDRNGIIRFVGHPLRLTRAVIESLL